MVGLRINIYTFLECTFFWTFFDDDVTDESITKKAYKKWNKKQFIYSTIDQNMQFY